MRINSLRDALMHFPDIDGFWQISDLPATEYEIQTRLNQTKTPDLLIHMARVQALLGKMGEARIALDQAHALLESSAPDPRTIMRWHLENGRLQSLLMSPARAQEQFAQAWTLSNESGDTFIAIEAALMLSIVRPPKFQIEWLNKAFELASAAKDEVVRRWLPHLNFLNGWRSFDSRQYDGALESFEKALTFSDDLAYHWSRSRALRAQGKTEMAMEIQETLLNKMRSLGKVSGHVYLELAECKQLLKSIDEAKAYFELAHTELSADPWFLDNKKDELDRMKYISKKR